MKKNKTKNNGLLSALRSVCDSFWFDCVLDFLLCVILLIQDISPEYIPFGTTPPYKYLLVLFGFLLAVDHLTNKRRFGKKGLVMMGTLVFAWAFSIVVCRGKTVIVPGMFLLVEVSSVIFYINRVRKKDMQKRVFRIILGISLVLAALALVQVFAFRLGIKEVYLPLTQHMNYLLEGRVSSIYSEPAHLCTLFGGGVFVCLYSLLKKPRARYYAYLAILVLASLFSGSVITYIAVVICIITFLVFCFATRKEKDERHGRQVFWGFLTCLLVAVLYFTLLVSSETLDAMNNKIKTLSSASENHSTTSSVIENRSDGGQRVEKNENVLPPAETIDKLDEVVVVPGSLKSEEIVNVQASNSTSYAIKSNIKIGFEKMKDGYLFGTGMFSHIVFYDEYMRRLYPDGYLRINYADACSIEIRVLSEFGIIGLAVFVGLLLCAFIETLKRKEVFEFFLFAIFVTQSMRIGDYNLILTCFSFVYLMIIVVMPGVYNICRKAVAKGKE